MRYTVVYVDDNGTPSVYGTYGTRVRAKVYQEIMEHDIAPAKDIAGGGAGSVWVCAIQTHEDWKEL
jgi:hypothetical protein